VLYLGTFFTRTASQWMLIPMLAVGRYGMGVDIVGFALTIRDPATQRQRYRPLRRVEQTCAPSSDFGSLLRRSRRVKSRKSRAPIGILTRGLEKEAFRK
jgi:hypothetical protein